MNAEEMAAFLDRHMLVHDAYCACGEGADEWDLAISPDATDLSLWATHVADAYIRESK